MLDKAISKIKTEMIQNKDNAYIQVIGDFLLNYIKTNPASAEKIASSNNTIGKSLDEMKKAAEKKKVGNCAVLTDREGFAIVLKYFGVAEGAPSDVQLKNPSEQKSGIDFDLKLEDLL